MCIVGYPLLRLSYINTGELVMAQFTIPDHDGEQDDKVVTASNKQVGFHWAEFLDR